MLRSDFVRKFMSNGVAQGLNFGSRWLLNLALARQMLEHDFGVFSYLYMLANMFFPAIAFGSSFYLIHQTAKKADIAELVESIQVSLLVSLGLMCITLAVQYFSHDAIDWTLYVLSLGIGLSWAVSQACFSYLKGLQQFSVEVRSQFLTVLATIGLVIFIVLDWVTQIDHVLCGVLLISLLPLFAAWQALKGQIVLWHSSLHGLSWWRHTNWRPRLSYAWHDVFAIYLTNIPFVFLAIFSTLTALGQFRKAFVLFMPVTLLPVIFSQVLLAKLTSQPSPAAKKQFFQKVILLSLPLLSLPYAIVFIGSPWLYQWLLAEPLTAQMRWVTELVVLTLWLTLVKTYFEVWVTALGFNYWRASNVTLVALLGSALYGWVGKALTADSAAAIFLTSNFIAVLSLMLLSLLAYRRVSGLPNA